jgi:hypothetical protein
MERDKEITKLVNVLHRIARAAGYAAWSGAGGDASAFCASQYNRVLARLADLEPAVARLFTPLGEAARPEITRLAAAELAAYFEDEYSGGPRRRSHGCGGRGAWVGWATVGRGCR